jgi:leucyl aminopeptidase
MKLTPKDVKAAPAKTELLAVLALQGAKPALPAKVKIPDRALKDFKGDFRETRLADALAGPAERVLLVGLGKRGDADLERLRRAAAVAVKAAEQAKRGAATLWIDSAIEEAVGGAQAAGQAVAEGALLGAYSFSLKGKKEERKLKSVVAHGGGAAFRKGVQRGIVLAAASALARDLQNTPGNLMRPRDLVAEARKIAGRSERIRFKALDEKAMEKLGMGSLLSVSKGSEEPAFLIHLTYKPKGRAKGRVALVGKGLTFDAGGISLKPPAKMDEMKYDMSGGAAVLGVFHALAKLDVPFEVHGLVPTSENLPDGRANKPGDIVKAMNGTTIEVLNTDAEGRLILCDALAYAVEKVAPDTIVDLATLTGAVVVALGHEVSGMFATTDALARGLTEAGERTGELVWRLPLLDAHKEQMKGKVGDLRNINSGEGNGSIAGAAFLSGFVGDTEWAHLDIAGTAWGGIDRDYVGGPAGSGVGVRLLLRWLDGA